MTEAEEASEDLQHINPVVEFGTRVKHGLSGDRAGMGGLGVPLYFIPDGGASPSSH